VLVGVQVAATALLLLAATMLARALYRLETLDPGWSAENVLAASLDLTLNGTDRSRGQQFYRELHERVVALPGVEAAALAAKLPLGGRSSFGPVRAAGLETPPGQAGFEAYVNRVSPGYFRTLGIALIRGREISPTDAPGAATVAVVNRSMAARLWPGRDAVGQRFVVGSGERLQTFDVIGVAEDVKYSRLDEVTPNFYYVAVAQWYNPEQVLHVKSARDAAGATAAAIRSVVRELDPSLPVPPIRPMTEALALFILPQRLAAFTAGAMGLFGLLLAAVGVYGVTAFVVTRRTREIGVRMALGGTARDISRLLLRQGSLSPKVGLAAGLGMGAVFARFISQVVSGVTPADPVAFGGTAATIALVAAAAILIPVWRVLRRNPLAALRDE
jgi:predicted permease